MATAGPRMKDIIMRGPDKGEGNSRVNEVGRHGQQLLPLVGKQSREMLQESFCLGSQ